MARKLIPMKRPESKVFAHPYEVVGKGTVEYNGRLLKMNKFEVYDPIENFSGFDANDFCLENILAIGATDLLVDRKLNMDKLQIVENLNDGVEYQQFMLDLDAANNNDKNTDE